MQRLLLCLAVWIGLGSAAMALEPPKVEYSADTRMETADAVIEGVVFHARDKERRETKTGGDAMTMIIRQDKKVIWMLMPDANAYMEMGVGQSQDKSDFSEYEIEETKVGEEVVNGVKTTKKKVIMTKKDGSKLGGFWWTTKDDIPVKMDMIAVEGQNKDRIKIELTNLKVGKQDPRLFEIPEGYMNMSRGMPNLKDLMQEREPIDEGRPGTPPNQQPNENEGFDLQKIFDLMK